MKQIRVYQDNNFFSVSNRLILSKDLLSEWSQCCCSEKDLKFLLCSGLRYLVAFFATHWISYLGLLLTKYCGLVGLAQQKSIVSQSWKPQVPNQGIGKAMLPLKMLGEGLFQASLLAPGRDLAGDSIVPIFTWFSPCMFVSVSKFPPFLK